MNLNHKYKSGYPQKWNRRKVLQRTTIQHLDKSMTFIV